MDRSVLSDPAVVAASRDFVCARLLTYESAEEAKFLESLFRGRTGQLENTVFTILAPDGKTPLAKAGRSPDMVFGTVKQMVEAMKDLAAKHPGKAGVARELPWVVDLRRALNVAACELKPLVVVKGAALEAALAPLAWSADFVGRFEYARAGDAAELGKIEGAARKDGVYVAAPDAYGQKAKLLAAADSPAGIRKALESALKAFAPAAKDSRKHIEEGRRGGIRWETEIPVTDPGPGR